MDVNEYKLNTIFDKCRECGTCCKKYSKILLQAEEVDFLQKMGAHIGCLVPLYKLRDKPLSEVIQEEQQKNAIYMVHPDGKGCVFLEKRNDKYFCKIYYYRPKTCQGFKCNLVDNTMKDLFLNEPMTLLGMDKHGIKL